MIFGLPNLVGFVVVGAVGTVILFIGPRLNRAILLAAADVLSGFVAVFAGVIIAGLMNVRPTAWLPMLAGVWFAIYFTRSARFGEFARASFGTLCGWWAYATFAG